MLVTWLPGRGQTLSLPPPGIEPGSPTSQAGTLLCHNTTQTVWALDSHHLTLHKTTYWPLILMALCIIDFIGGNGLLGRVGRREPWVRSFSRPEKLPLKIHTGSSGTIYSYWVEKALLFANWSSFSRQMQSPYVSNSCGFSLNPALRTHSSFLAVPARPAVNRYPPCPYPVMPISRTFGRRVTKRVTKD